MNFKTIILEKDQKIARLTLNRPEAMNSMNMAMFEELEAAFKEVMSDTETRVLIVTGRGRAFSAGADFSLVSSLSKLPSKEFIEKIRYFQSVITLLEEMEKIVIAAINGYALGGGLDLALACDLRIAVENARLGEQYVKVGIMPDLGGTQRLPRLVGLAKAKEMIFLGEMIDAREAQQLGLINRVIAEDAFESEVMALARGIGAGPSVAIGLAKKAINNGLAKNIKDGLELEAYGQNLCMQTEDVKEGIAAFREKRNPEFKGK